MTLIEVIISGIIPAIATGFGVAIGTWAAQRHLIKNIERLEAQLRKKTKRKVTP